METINTDIAKTLVAEALAQLGIKTNKKPHKKQIARDTMEGVPDMPGLFIRTSPTGKRSWCFYMWIGKYKQPIRRKIGACHLVELAEAKTECRNIYRQLLTGEMSIIKRMRTSRASEATVGHVFKRYWKMHVVHNNARPKYIWRSFELHWQSISDIRVTDLNPLMIQSWMNQIKQNTGSGTANRQFNQLKSTLRWGAAMQVCALPPNLFLPIKVFKTDPAHRYLKTGSEYSRLAHALNARPGKMADAIWLLLFTGVRKRNLLSMRWEQIDFESKIWTIPKTKSGKSHAVPLTSNALEVLARRREQISKTPNRNTPWVFPAIGKRGHVQNVDHFWRTVRKSIKLDDVRVHDLRHTVGTWLGLNGASAFTIQRALGHSNLETTGRYTHLHVDMVREALEQSQRFGMATFGLQSAPVALPRPLITPTAESGLPKNADVKIRAAEQVIIEGKVLTTIRAGLRTKKDFYRKLGGQFQVNSVELERILSEMIERQLIDRYQEDSGCWKYVLL